MLFIPGYIYYGPQQNQVLQPYIPLQNAKADNYVTPAAQQEVDETSPYDVLVPSRTFAFGKDDEKKVATCFYKLGEESLAHFTLQNAEKAPHGFKYHVVSGCTKMLNRDGTPREVVSPEKITHIFDEASEQIWQLKPVKEKSGK